MGTDYSNNSGNGDGGLRSCVPQDGGWINARQIYQPKILRQQLLIGN